MFYDKSEFATAVSYYCCDSFAAGGRGGIGFSYADGFIVVCFEDETGLVVLRTEDKETFANLEIWKFGDVKSSMLLISFRVWFFRRLFYDKSEPAIAVSYYSSYSFAAGGEAGIGFAYADGFIVVCFEDEVRLVVLRTEDKETFANLEIWKFGDLEM